MGTNLAVLELELRASAAQVEAEMAAMRKSIAADVADLDRRMRKVVGFDTLPKSARAAGAAINSLSGQTGNIAAQFQDIAVQLQGGGSPFTIALQQGTQLGAVFSGAGGLGAAVKGVGAAFASMLSPVNLVTIGLIAAGGAAVKYFMGRDDAEAMTEALKRQPEIIAAIRDAWGEAAAKAAEYSHESAGVVAAQVKEQSETLASAVATAAQSESEALRSGLQDLRVDTSGLAMPELADLGRAADAAGIDALKAAVDDLDRSIADGSPKLLTFRDALSAIVVSSTVSDDVRSLASSLLAETKEAGEAARAVEGLVAAQNAAVSTTNALVAETKIFNELMSQGLYQQAAQHAQTLGQALDAAAAAQRALNEEQGRFAAERLADKGASYEALNDYYQRRAAGLPATGGDAPSAPKAAKRDPYAELIKSGERFIATQQLEAQALGMTTQAAAALRYEQDMLNRLTDGGVTATDEQRQAIQALAAKMAEAEAAATALGAAQQQAAEAQQEFKDFGADLLRGFIDDLKSAKSGSDVLAGALGRLAAKMEDLALNALFNSGSSSGGLFGFLGKIFGGLFGGGGGPLDLGSFLKNAKGGVFASPSLSAYSGRVVARPTPFTFARGAGLMGEAGPEAIMPLRRGPDGRLGVQAGGGSGGGGSKTMTINIVGATGNDEIRAMVEKGVSAGIRSYDREALPARVKHISANPRLR